MDEHHEALLEHRDEFQKHSTDAIQSAIGKHVQDQNTQIARHMKSLKGHLEDTTCSAELQEEIKRINCNLQEQVRESDMKKRKMTVRMEQLQAFVRDQSGNTSNKV